jgi:hypothetical protein
MLLVHNIMGILDHPVLTSSRSGHVITAWPNKNGDGQYVVNCYKHKKRDTVEDKYKALQCVIKPRIFCTGCELDKDTL